MLRLDDISKSYADGEQVVDVIRGMSFALDGGTSLALTGPSGSGKSTLLNLMAGVIVPDEGQITVKHGSQTLDISGGKSAVRTRLRRQYIGYIHQFFNLIPTLTVRENVQLPAQLVGQVQAREKAQDMLSLVELRDKADAFPDTLSGGQQQRVAVARALINRPLLVLADEPTGNLDRGNAQRVSDLLFETCKDHAAMLIVATHSDAVAGRADQTIDLGQAPGAIVD